MKTAIGHAALLLAGVLLAAHPAGAEGTSDFDNAALYNASCAPCHGPTGMGGGPVAAALKKPLPMIATLTRRHGGTFPSEYVHRIIDGRAEVTAHGSRVMPVWGAVLNATHYGDGKEHSAKVMIDALVEHIKRLQIE